MTVRFLVAMTIDGTAYAIGDIATLPVSLAIDWVSRGWVEEIPYTRPTPGADAEVMEFIISPAAADDDAILAQTVLTAAAQAVTAGINELDVPRNLVYKGNVAGINGNVTAKGVDGEGVAITETKQLNGATAVIGDKAFAKVYEVGLPARNHTGVAQVETIAVTHGASAAGTLIFRVTAAGMTGSLKDVDVDVTTDDDTTAEVAAKIRAALGLDADVSAFFEVGGMDANVVLTAKAPAANDATLAMALQDADSSSVTVGASADTTAGVPNDLVSIGWGSKLGLPEKWAGNKIIPKQTFLDGVPEGTEPTIAVDADHLYGNTVLLNSALDGSEVRINYIK